MSTWQDPFLRRLHSDPRRTAFLRKLGLAADRLKSRAARERPTPNAER